jgi:hypothetical protein
MVHAQLCRIDATTSALRDSPSGYERSRSRTPTLELQPSRGPQRRLMFARTAESTAGPEPG